MAVDVTGVVLSPVWLRILAGLFLIRAALNLRDIPLDAADGSLVRILYEEGHPGGLTLEEWLNAAESRTNDETTEVQSLDTLSIEDLRTRAERLVRLGAIVEISKDYWAIKSDIALS